MKEIADRAVGTGNTRDLQRRSWVAAALAHFGLGFGLISWNSSNLLSINRFQCKGVKANDGQAKRQTDGWMDEWMKQVVR